MNNSKENRKSIYQYLEPLLNAGADELTLIHARKQYLRHYKHVWQTEYRKQNKQFTISFNKEEQKIVHSAAIDHKRKTNRFIKEAVLAYCNQKLLLPDPGLINQLQQLLTKNYTSLQELLDEKEFDRSTQGKFLADFRSFEQNINVILKNFWHK